MVYGLKIAPLPKYFGFGSGVQFKSMDPNPDSDPDVNGKYKMAYKNKLCCVDSRFGGLRLDRSSNIQYFNL
jgi:hypothetical protein